jgi:hypothetical protein
MGAESILQYTDDTIIFMERDIQKELNMKYCAYLSYPD